MKKSSGLVIQLIVYPAKVVIVCIYRVGFGWWLDKLLTGHSDRKLKNRIREDLPFLFRNHGAHFVPNDRPYGKGGTIATIEVGPLLLRIGHNRGEDFVDVKAKDVSGEWEPIGLALMVSSTTMPIVSPEDLPPYQSFVTLAELAPILECKLEQLQESFAPPRYSGTRGTLATIRSFPKYARHGRLVKPVSESQTGKSYNS